MIKNEDAYQCTLSCYAAAEGCLAPYSYRKARKMSDIMILEKISIEFINSKIPSPSIDMSRPSRDPYHPLNLNLGIRILIQGHFVVILTLTFPST